MAFHVTDKSNFTSVDFVPGIEELGGFFTKSTFVSFRSVIDHANEFLRSNRKWNIVTCESVEYRSLSENVAFTKMKYTEYGSIRNSYVRGLRLWLSERADGDEREQQIDYINLVPQQLDDGGMFSSPKFETLDAVIERFNTMIRSNPIPGRIINIESQEMKVPTFDDLNPDRSSWTEQTSSTRTRFLFVLRIFYEKGDFRYEEIGVADFIPDLISRGGICSHPRYEQFSNVVNKASTWLAQQVSLRFCNGQTLEIKMKSGKGFDSRRMNYTEHGDRTTYYIRIFRVAFTKPPYSISEETSPIRHLTCRVFPPMQLTTGCCPKFEDLLVTRERISAWVRATGARVVSAETTAYRLRTGGERKQGVEASFTYNRKDVDEIWIFVIRLYLDGVYPEPHPEMLPPPPVIENKCCCIVS